MVRSHAPAATTTSQSYQTTSARLPPNKKLGKQQTKKLVSQAIKCIQANLREVHYESKQLRKESIVIEKGQEEHFSKYALTQQPAYQKLINQLYT